MKERIFTTFLIIALASITNAQRVFPTAYNESHKAGGHKQQQEEAQFFVGGATTYWKDNKAKTVKFNLEPEMGYMFNENWGVGLLLGYGYTSKKESLSGSNHYLTSFKVSPFVRYYYLHKGPFNIYFDAGFGFNSIKYEKGDISASSEGFEIGIRPGACVDLTEGLCLCLRMGFLGYRKDYAFGEEEGLSSNGFGIKFAPEELMIGLELEF